MKIKYFDIAWLSKVDGPGNRVVLFLQGCHLKCPWCHSPHSREKESPILFNQTRCIGCYNCLTVCSKGVHVIENGVHRLKRDKCVKCGKCVGACPTSRFESNSGALSLPTKYADTSEVFELLLPQLEIVKGCGGLTISGGEALLQKEAVKELLQYCKATGIHTAIETSLTLSTEVYAYVKDYVDCWLIGMRDISFQGGREDMDELVKKNVRYISSLGREVIVRLPVIKGYTETRYQLDRITGLMFSGEFKTIELLPCNREMEHYYVLSGTAPQLSVEKVLPDKYEIAGVADYFRAVGFNANIVTQ